MSARWIAGVPMQDLVMALDDADGRILYARFFPHEEKASTFAALESVLRRAAGSASSTPT